MKIHSICIAKNEADIIAQTLNKAIKWCDYIYVVDNGSSDDTWKKILNLSQKYKQIIPYKQDDRTFYDGMRSEVFYNFRSNSQNGDWWCRLDADEFYIDDPRTFLSEIPNQYQAVWAASFQYYFTDKDLECYERSPSSFSNSVPVEQKCRYYLNNWSENRFFKYDLKLVWDKDRGWPYFGAIYPKRIRLKHYQYRSPQQIQQRSLIRLQAGFVHEAQILSTCKKSPNSLSPFATKLLPSYIKDIWKKRIVKASELNFDYHNDVYLMREDLMPPLPKTYFPHIENKFRYLKKYINKTTLNKFRFLLGYLFSSKNKDRLQSKND
ncbi:glycosyltransferase family 2 protein [Myxosarcina sp. GI1]|uniref:glycosyltransferase family 2 protein n=1 Tax=Myxosarcina sp. GI1 TaxID=1541065 RepID=UPI000907CEE4|nr:glycosyltransferase family 2 protein [Myxosarcina sp. GI1]